MPGLFITIEGVECSGKSSQSTMLIEYCQKHNIPAILVREPGGTELGEKLRNILLSTNCTPITEFLIFSASRAQLTETIIKPHLEKNYIVISDRYFHSSIAYQGYGRCLDIQALKQISDFATQSLHPDITFLLSPSKETAFSRLEQKKATIGLDRIELENLDFHEKIYDGFQKIMQEYNYFYNLNGDLSTQIIHQQIITHLSSIDNRFSTIP